MTKAKAKLPKPTRINRKLTLSRETIARLSNGPAPTAHKCTGFRTGCLPYTC